jgi:hypothetical protein
MINMLVNPHFWIPRLKFKTHPTVAIDPNSSDSVGCKRGSDAADLSSPFG